MPASWGLPGLDEATADRLYEQVKARTLAGPQPEPIKMPYTPFWLEAAEMSGATIIESTEARGEPRDTVWEANLMGDDQGRRYDSAYAYLRPAMEGALPPLLRTCASNTRSCHAPLCAETLQSHSLVNRPGTGVATGGAVVQARAAATCGWFRMPQSARCCWRTPQRWAWSVWWGVTQRRR